MIKSSSYYLVLQNRFNGDIFRAISHDKNTGDEFDFNDRPVVVLFAGTKKDSIRYYKTFKGER